MSPRKKGREEDELIEEQESTHTHTHSLAHSLTHVIPQSGNAQFRHGLEDINIIEIQEQF